MCKQLPRALPCSMAAMAACYQLLCWVQGCTRTLLWLLGVLHLPGTICHSAWWYKHLSGSGMGTGTHCPF